MRFLRLILYSAVLACPLGADTSQRILLQGIVRPVTHLDVAVSSAAQNLNIAGGQAPTAVAQFLVHHNNSKGFEVTVTSQNAQQGRSSISYLKGMAGSFSVPYSLECMQGSEAQEVVFENGVALLFNRSERTPATGLDGELRIKLKGITAPADTYQDVLTLTLTAK